MLKVVSKRTDEMEDGGRYRKRMEEEREERLAAKRMHGKILGEMKEVGTERNWQWVKSGFMSKSVEGFMFAAQEQALRTRWLRANIEKEKINESCRICGKQMETIVHLVASCEVLAKGGYKRRHDKVGLRVYWEMCRKSGIKCTEKWYEEIPDKVRTTEDGMKEIWWDRKVETSEKMDHIRPDVVLLDMEKGECTIVDFSVPWDKNVLKKEQEKIDSYVPLAKDMTKVRKMTTKIVPVVIGGLGLVSPNLSRHIKSLGIPDVIGSLQTAAIIGTYGKS